MAVTGWSTSIPARRTTASPVLAPWGRTSWCWTPLDRSRRPGRETRDSSGSARSPPGVRLVQFVDGDCELSEGWLGRAASVLDERREVAAVCGRLRERHPERSVYNRLADLEWNGPVGEIKACGGIAMIRAEAFEAVGGFDPSIIAAEDDELCLRIRRRGWKIVRIDAEMALHDIAMYRFRQWWRRSTRTGHAYAEGAAMYGHTPERHFVRQTRSAVFWGITVPIVALGLAWPTRGISLAVLGGYVVLYWRICRYYALQSRLAAGGCSPVRRLDRPRQVPPGRRRGPVLARSAERRAERRHRASGSRPS